MYFLKNEKSYYKSVTFLNNNNFVIFKNTYELAYMNLTKAKLINSMK